MKINLPDVTLLIAETRDHELARHAINRCLAQCEFGEVVVCSNNFNILRIPGALYFNVEDWPDKIGWSKFHWYGTPTLVKTSHCLFIQWDSWVLDGSQWNPDWLKTDFIGAPWWYPNNNVGNGGFGMKSLELMKFLVANKERYPVTTNADDDLLCRKYRDDICKEHPFNWAGNDDALNFSFERIRRSAATKHFGFHGTFNWPWILEYEEVMELLPLLKGNYFQQSGMLAELHSMIATRMWGHEPWVKPNWDFDGERL